MGQFQTTAFNTHVDYFQVRPFAAESKRADSVAGCFRSLRTYAHIQSQPEGN
jgi:hypothetical protein